MTMTMIMMFPQNKSFSLAIIVLLLLHGNLLLGKTRAFILKVPTSTFLPRLATTARGGPSWSSLSVAPHQRTRAAALSLNGGARRRRLLIVAAAVPRYGPSSSSLDRTGSVPGGNMDDDDNYASSPSSSSSQQRQQQQQQQHLSAMDRKNFKQLVQQVMSVRDAQHIPSLLTQNMELLFSVISASGGTEGVALVQDILNDFPEHDTDSDDDDDDNNDSDSSSSSATRASRRQVEETIDLMLSFAQDFVDQASQLDNQNKRLLGKIIKVISPARDNNNNNNTPKKTAWEREEALDKLLEQERDFLSAGFLRHLQGECKRIANAPTMTRESSRLLQVLSMIQTRVLEEMVIMDQNKSNSNNNNENNNKLGEAAMVLGQLIGYESKAERLAVLEAGLLVRNNNNGSDIAFAQEMRDLTLEALDGFTRVVGGADPGLVQIIQEIDERLEQFLVIAKTKQKQ